MMERPMTLNELTRTIEDASDAIGALHLQIIRSGCRAAFEELKALATALEGLSERIDQQDFMHIEVYEGMAKEDGKFCTCCHRCA
jgi:hypothetical protein